jgi:hypothetical protein
MDQSSCAACGRANRHGAKFCANCGGTLASKTPPAPPSPTEPPTQPSISSAPRNSTCPSCGKAVLDGASECWACAYTFGSGPPPADTVPAQATRSSSRSTAKPVLFGILAILICAGVGTMLLFRGRVTNSTAPTAPIAQALPVVESQPSAPQPTAPTATPQPQSAPTRPSQPEPFLAGKQSSRTTTDTPRNAPVRAVPTETVSPVSTPIAQSTAETRMLQTQITLPSEPSTGRSVPSEPVPILRPEPVPSVPPSMNRYSGPMSGTLIWSGQLDKNAPIEIDTGQPNGLVRGDPFPGVPVQLIVEPRDIAIKEPPSPSNGFKKLVIRSQNRRNVVVTIRWTVLQ